MSSTLAAQTKINKDVPYGLMVAAAWSWRLVATVIGLGVLWYLGGFVSIVIIPLIVAALLTVLLAPIHRGLRHVGVPGVLAALLCLLLLIAVVTGLVVLAGQQLVAGFAALSDQLGQAIDGFVGMLQGWGLNAQITSETIDGLWNTIRENSGTIVDSALTFGSSATNVIVGTLIALFTLIFFLYDGDRIWRFMQIFVPKAHRESVDRAGRSGWRALSSYVRVQIFVAFVDAVGIGLGAWLLDVPLAFPLAVLVFLASFIPFVGATVTGALAVLLALMANGVGNALLMLLVVVLVQQIESNILQPLVMGKAVSLHPLAVFLAVAAGSSVLGLVGALFAVPLLAFVNAFIRGLSPDGPQDLVSREDEALTPSRPVEPHGSHAVSLDADDLGGADVGHEAPVSGPEGRAAAPEGRP